MSSTINQPNSQSQEQSTEVDHFVLFRFLHGLGKGIKARIKSRGCSWYGPLQGWLCPVASQEEVKKELKAAGLQCEMQTLSLPKGIIPTDPKLAGRHIQLEILDEQIHRDDKQLLEDVYRYDASLRPEDFAQAPCEEGKSQERIRIERDFHSRWIGLQKAREAAEKSRKGLAYLDADAGEKIFDFKAPLLITDAFIKEQFLWEQKHRTLHHCSNTFWQWDGVRYMELSEGAMRQRIYSFLRDAKALNDKGHLENFNPSKYKVDQIVDALRAVCHHDHHPTSGAIWLDGRKNPDPKYLISFRNGLLNMADWLENPSVTLAPHTPLLMNVNSLTFDYDPLASEPQEWLKFLHSVWPNDQESQQTLQEWSGYSLTQDTRLHKILLIIGPTRSGKGTIGRCLLELLGSFNVIGPTLSSIGGEFGLQPFLNKMLALISDARLKGKTNNSVIIERLLSISGEDPLTINRKFLPPITVQLPTRIMMMSNELPDLRDASGALANRYVILTMTKSWLGKEDTSLSARLRAELPGILLWALHGLARLQERGKFLQPGSSAQIAEELEAMTSPIKVFIAQRCEFKPEATISVATLYTAWQTWCTATGHPFPGNVQSFGRDLRAAVPQIEMTRPEDDQKRERYYKGITLIPNPSADVRGQWEE